MKKVYTDEDLESVPIEPTSYRMLPKGDYSEVKNVPARSRFDFPVSFGNGVNFKDSYFQKPMVAGHHCSFRDCWFDSYTRFGNYSFIGECSFNGPVWIGEKAKLRGTSIWDPTTIIPNCALLLDNRCWIRDANWDCHRLVKGALPDISIGYSAMLSSEGVVLISRNDNIRTASDVFRLDWPHYNRKVLEEVEAVKLSRLTTR